MLMTKKQLNDYIYNSFLPDTAKRIIDETPESNTEYYDVYYIIKDKGVDIDEFEKKYLDKETTGEIYTFRTEPLNTKEAIECTAEFYKSVQIARESGVPDEEILKTKHDIDKYFMS